MSKSEVTAASMQGAFDALGMKPEAGKLAAYAASLQVLLRTARPGFDALAFEAEPAAFHAEQGRRAP